eukprot:11884666-Karenia_brevis.AAC.1
MNGLHGRCPECSAFRTHGCDGLAAVNDNEATHRLAGMSGMRRITYTDTAQNVCTQNSQL